MGAVLLNHDQQASRKTTKNDTQIQQNLETTQKKTKKTHTKTAKGSRGTHLTPSRPKALAGLRLAATAQRRGCVEGAGQTLARADWRRAGAD